MLALVQKQYTALQRTGHNNYPISTRWDSISHQYKVGCHRDNALSGMASGF